LICHEPIYLLAEPICLAGPAMRANICSEVGRIDRRTCLPDAVDLVGERGSDGGLTDCTDCYTCTVRLYCCTDLRREDASAGSAPRSHCSTELLRAAGSTELDASAHACCGSAGERWVTIGESGFCCCWIERPRRWLSGRLETNINIDNTEGHQVPHPALTNKLSLVPHGLAHVRLRRPCYYLHRYSYGPSR
jgi:hypothetical protein